MRKSWRQVDAAPATSAADADPRRYVADMVYRARSAARISQDELARRAGTSQAVISAIENAVQVPGGVMLARIASALGGTLRIHVD